MLENEIKKQENYYNSLIVKNNDLYAQINEKEAHLQDLLNATDIAQYEYNKADKDLALKKEELKASQEKLNNVNNEIQLIQKDIQISQLSLKSLQEKAEDEKNYNIALQNFFEAEPFYIEFLKKMKRVKRNGKGEVIDVISLYDVYLQARERRKYQINRTLHPNRRLPDGGADIETGGRHPEMESDDFEL